MNRSPLLLKLLARMGEIEFKEGWLPAEGRLNVYGQWEPTGIITINPMPHVVDTILHELIHEAEPRWSERAVSSMTGKLMKQLSEDEIQMIYSEYRRTVD